MENNNQLPNITPSVMFTEKSNSENKKKDAQHLMNKDDFKKNYLNVMLEDGQVEKTLTIRLLPMDLDPNSKTYGNPFVKIFTHNVKVPVEVSGAKNADKSYKNYICLSRTNGINHDELGYKCPFCEINQSAYAESEKETDAIKKKEWRKISVQNIPRETVIVRCIDRDHQEDGVKFWKFNIREDKTDPYNQIINLFNLRYEEGKRSGVDINILDIYNGVDLTVKITRGNSAPTITDGRIPTPLSKDEKQLQDWLYDTKKWQDVFTAKPYEYLSLVANMRVPWKDKVTGKWVDKEELLNRNETKKAEISETDKQFVQSMTVNEEDLPF